MGFLTGLLGDLAGGQAGAMFKESVGVDPRMLKKLSRMVGGKNLAMLGAGAAIGGAALASGQSAGGGPSDWDAPRGPATAPPATNPPPTPAAQAPPPPPPGAAPPPPPPAGIAGVGVAAAAGAAAGAAAAASAAGTGAAAAAPPADDHFDSVDAIEDAIPDALAYGIARAMVAAALADGHLDDRERSMVEGRLETSGLSDEEVAQIRRDLALPPQPRDLAAQVTDPDERAAVYRFAGLVILAADGVSELERAWLDRLSEAFGFDADRKAALEAELFVPDDFAPNDEV